jgi:quercetin dioxygenase-like cupin family protein
VVCGHSHCGAIRALYGEVRPRRHLAQWLELGREAALPVAEPGPEVLRRTEQRAVVLQLERLMDYPMVRQRVEAGTLALHGWHYVIEDGEVHVFDVQRGGFVPAYAAGRTTPAPGPLAGRQHQVAGEITLLCIEGLIEFTAQGRSQRMAPGQLIHLAGGEPHALRAVDDATALLTICVAPA